MFSVVGLIYLFAGPFWSADYVIVGENNKFTRFIAGYTASTIKETHIYSQTHSCSFSN